MARGFTLIELIVVISLIGFFSVFMLANYRGGRAILAEQRSAQTVAQSIRAAQNKALASECDTPPCRFGVHFDTSSQRIEIFIDSEVMNAQYDPGEELADESYKLEARVFIENLSPNYSCPSPPDLEATCLDILFDPPDPEVIFNPSGGDLVIITTTGERSVTAGIGGSIDIN